MQICFVIPAKAGIQRVSFNGNSWIPAYAGMMADGVVQ